MMKQKRLFHGKGYLFIAVGGLWLLSACTSGQNNSAGKSIPDFSLGASDSRLLPPRTKKAKQPLRVNDNSSLVKTSFPVAVRVGKGHDRYDRVPGRALAPSPVFYVKKIDNCLIGVQSDTFLVNRYLGVKGDLIKMEDGLTPGDLVRVDVGQDLYLSIATTLRPHLLKSQAALCAKSLKGKKIYVGRASFIKSQIGLLNSPGSPMVAMSMLASQPVISKVFVQWKEADMLPEVVDENQIPVTLESQVHKATFKKDGFYYVTSLPNLRVTP